MTKELPKPYYEDEKAGITIYHGDCREILPYLPTVDLILADPPYGIKRDRQIRSLVGEFKNSRNNKGRRVYCREYNDNWDRERIDKKSIELILSSANMSIIWGGNFYADILPRSSHWIFWDKLQTMPTFSDGEIAWTNIDRKSVKKNNNRMEWTIRERTKQISSDTKTIGILPNIK